MNDKVKENRLRRLAARRGLTLQRSRRRDQGAVDFGGYMLLDEETGEVVAGSAPVAYSYSLDAVEVWLNRRRRKPISGPSSLVEITREQIILGEQMVEGLLEIGASPAGEDEYSRRLRQELRRLKSQRELVARAELDSATRFYGGVRLK